MSHSTDFMANSNIHAMSAPHTHSHYILWGMFTFITIMVTWAYFAVIDEVTTGTGKIIPSSQVQVIQNLEGGIIQEILVQEGDIVEKGQILMRIDDTQFSSSFKESTVKINSLIAKISRLEAEASNSQVNFSEDLKRKFPDLIKNELALYKSRKMEKQTRLEILNNQLNQRISEKYELIARQHQNQKSLILVQKELDMTKPLLESGSVSPVEVLRLERQITEIEGEMESLNTSHPRIEAAIAEAKNKITEFETAMRTQILDEIASVKTDLASLKENETALQDRVDRTTVRSPIKGTVKTINVTTVGGVIQPGMDLIEIVPFNDTMLVEAYIRPSDIAFLRPGQTANVKVTAYDYSIYGGLSAQIEHISADTIKNEKDEDLYEIHVRTEQNLVDKNGAPLRIIPGMMVTVDILTGHKTILDYLLKPILKAKQNALRER